MELKAQLKHDARLIKRLRSCIHEKTDQILDLKQELAQLKAEYASTPNHLAVPGEAPLN